MKIKLYLCFLCFLFLLVNFLPKPCFAQEEIDWRKEAEETAQKADLSSWQEILEENEIDLDVQTLLQTVLEGEWSLSPQKLLKMIFTAFAGQDFLREFSFLLFCAVLSCFLAQAQSTFLSARFKDALEMLCLLPVLFPLMKLFLAQVYFTREAVMASSRLAQEIYPALLSLSTVFSGGFAFLSPLTLFVTSFMPDGYRFILYPFLQTTCGMECISTLFMENRLQGISQLCITFLKWALGIVGTVFGATLLMGDLLSNVFDGVSVRTAKYAVDKMIPIVGGVFKDQANTFLGAGLLLKNGLGITGLCSLGMLLFRPALRLLTTGLVLRIIGAFVQLVGEKNVTSVFQSFASMIQLLFTALLSLGAMLLMLLASLIRIGQ